MRVLCRHGYFSFYPKRARDVARYARFFDQALVRVSDFYTFEALAELPRYSLTAKVFGNLPALTTYEGRGPWDVMRENGFVYHIQSKLLVPKLTVIGVVQSPRSDSYGISPAPLIQPGTRDASGEQILSYDAEFIQDSVQLKLIEVDYE